MFLKRGLPEEQKWNSRSFIKSSYVYIILILIILALSLLSGQMFQKGNFLYPASLSNLLRMSVPILILAAGFTFIMVSGNIDLSVGSELSLASVFSAMLFLNGVPFILVIFITIAMGFVMGFVNGWMVAKLRITPVIATLITMNVYQGIARYLVPVGVSAIKSGNGLSMPSWIAEYARSEVFLGLSSAFFVAIIVIAILVFLQKKTLIGKYTAAVGGNRTAAELSGINSVKVVWGLYILMGVLAGIAGIARTSYMSLGDPLTGVGVETQCIIAVLLGGTAFTGGEGSVIKSVIGALIIVSLTIGLKSVIPEYWQSLAIGVVMVLAVTLNHILVREKVHA
jgi:ribose/xylose/arabinose/galactoside ABC-type transport system permease subunit